MDEKQKKYLYIGMGVVGSIVLLIGLYYLYESRNATFLGNPIGVSYKLVSEPTPEKKEIVTSIEAKESLKSQQTKGDIAMASRV